MPHTYQGTCAACGHKTDGYTEHLELRTDTDGWVPVSHPGETYSLAQAGYTWERAEEEKRLQYVHPFRCTQCGLQVYVSGDRVPSCVGIHPMTCDVTYTAWAAIWIMCLLLLPVHWLIRPLAALAASWVFSKAYNLCLAPVIRRAEAQLPPPTPCTRCGGTDLVGISATRARVICPECGQREMQYELVAVS